MVDVASRDPIAAYEAADTESSQADIRPFQCPHCSSAFKRPEHLKRHQRGHEQSRRFTCVVCSKKFTRSDILAKHSSIHTRPVEEEESSPNASGNGSQKKRQRACVECARVREKCTKGQPCSRCQQKKLSCVYPALPAQQATDPQPEEVSPSAHYDPEPNEQDYLDSTPAASRSANSRGLMPSGNQSMAVYGMRGTVGQTGGGSSLVPEDRERGRLGYDSSNMGYSVMPMNSGSRPDFPRNWSMDEGDGVFAPQAARGQYTVATPSTSRSMAATTFPQTRTLPYMMHPHAQPMAAAPPSMSGAHVMSGGVYGLPASQSPGARRRDATQGFDINYMSVMELGLGHAELGRYQNGEEYL